MLRFRCPVCAATCSAPDDRAGRKAACPACRAAFVVPGKAGPTEVWRPTPSCVVPPKPAPPPVRQRQATAAPPPPAPPPEPTLDPEPAYLPPLERPRVVPRLPRGAWVTLPLLALVTAAAALLAWRPWQGATAPAHVTFPPPARQGPTGLVSAGELRAAVRQHPFWREPLADGQLDSLLTHARDLPAAGVLWVDDHGLVAVWRTAEDRTLFDAMRRNRLDARTRPPGPLGARCLYLDMSQWRTRPDEAQILARLKELLDETDFALPRQP